jgi:DNA-binding LacI/PurR family transcriptional regulator
MSGPTQSIKPISTRSKTEAACEALAELARRAGPDGRLPTVMELCKSFQISRMTLDRAMGRLQRQGVIVRRHGQGIFAAPARTRTVGVLFGLDPFRIACSPFYHLLFDAIRRRLAERDYELEMYVDLAYDKSHVAVRKRLEADIAGGRIQGLLLPVSGREQWEWVGRQGIPFVGGGGTWMDGYRVGYDWRRMVDELVGRLAGRGCRRIGLVSHPLSLQVMRMEGDAERRCFEAALSREHLPVNPDLIYQIPLEADEFPDPPAPTYEEKGFLLGRQLAADPAQLPDGLLVSDDMVARGVLTGLARAGIHAGRQIQVATHINRGSPALIGFEQDLIRVELDAEEIAGPMIEMLESLMAGRPPGERALLISPAWLRENAE